MGEVAREKSSRGAWCHAHGMGVDWGFGIDLFNLDKIPCAISMTKYLDLVEYIFNTVPQLAALREGESLEIAPTEVKFCWFNYPNLF